MPRRVGVIGAGMAGLTCAHELTRAGDEVIVFDKARGPGGRMASRRTDDGTFDLGAQYFTGRSDAFRAAVEEWVTEGVVAHWSPNIVTLPGRLPYEAREAWYVGAPRMSTLTRALADELPDVRYGKRIAELTRAEETWSLRDVDGETTSGFDVIVLAIPGPQAVALVEELEPNVSAMIRAEVNMVPTWAMVIALEAPVDAGFDAAFVDESPVSWMARDSGKPAREGGERWVVHADSDWSEEHLEATPEQVTELLLAAVSELVPLPPIRFATAHRWRYARVSTPLGAMATWNSRSRLGICGDWFIGPRVEAAWLSGRALANLMRA